MSTVVVNKYTDEYDVYIGRGSKWGNPFVIGKDGERDEVIEKYHVWIKTQPHLMSSLHELKDKRLGCFCRPWHKCHGDVLVELVEGLMSKKEELNKVNTEISCCKKCCLCEGRTNVVPGEGNYDADIMIIGEGPGFDEDQQGRPFVGRSGKLLSIIIKKELNLERSDVFIANVVKCRPPNNRYPQPEEVSKCISYLKRQIDIIKPKVIITLGRAAFQYLIEYYDISIGQARGNWYQYESIPVMPTYHPSFLLRGMTEEKKNAVKSDLKKVVEKIISLKSEK